MSKMDNVIDLVVYGSILVDKRYNKNTGRYVNGNLRMEISIDRLKNINENTPKPNGKKRRIRLSWSDLQSMLPKRLLVNLKNENNRIYNLRIMYGEFKVQPFSSVYNYQNIFKQIMVDYIFEETPASELNKVKHRIKIMVIRYLKDNPLYVVQDCIKHFAEITEDDIEVAKTQQTKLPVKIKRSKENIDRRKEMRAHINHYFDTRESNDSLYSNIPKEIRNYIRKDVMEYQMYQRNKLTKEKLDDIVYGRVSSIAKNSGLTSKPTSKPTIEPKKQGKVVNKQGKVVNKQQVPLKPVVKPIVHTKKKKDNPFIERVEDGVEDGLNKMINKVSKVYNKQLTTRRN